MVAPIQGLFPANPSRGAALLDLPVDVKRDYGASGSAQTTTGTVAAGSKTLTLAGPIDFANGQGISVVGAGAAGALLVTSIVGGAASTTLTLAAAAGTTVNAAAVQHDDTAAIQSALAVVGADPSLGLVLITEGTYRVSSTLSIPNSVAIAGKGSALSVLRWSGSAGHTVIGTAALTAQSPAFSAPLTGFGIIIPAASVAAGTVGLYVAMPNAPIWDVSVQTESTTAGWVAGAYGIELDGTANPGPFPMFAAVAGHFEHCIYVRCNHANLYACSGAYGAFGVSVDEDSLASGSGPPYDVFIAGFHGYVMETAAFHIIRDNSVRIVGGFSEQTPTVVQVESTSAGTIHADSPTTTGGARLVHYGGATVYYGDVQDNGPVTVAYTGQANGTPQVANYLTQQRALWTPAQYTTGSTTPIALGSNASAIHNGPAGMFKVRFAGQVFNSTIGDGMTLGIYQSATEVAQGAALTGGGAGSVTLTQEGAASNPVPFTVEYVFSGQSTSTFFTLGAQAVTGGQVTVQNLVCEIEAI